MPDLAGAQHLPIRTEEIRIEMADGVPLAATLYRPDSDADGPFPVVLESIPYRKDDWTLTRDRPLHGAFAARGYVGVRLDVRGTGSSAGIAEGEYTEREQLDNLEVIAWLAAQPWSTGAVGMFGISWGGFSALQAAVRRPPALRAIIPVHFSHDRYGLDVHYVGGTLHAGESAYWPVEMVGQNALPPDPERWVGHEGRTWREEWLHRLDRTPQWQLERLAHPRRDAHWRAGSAGEDWAAIEAPILAIGGLNDAYREAVLAVLEHARVQRRGVIGPWGHSWPHAGWPGPSIDGIGLMVRWWDRWLKGIRNGVDEEPMLAVFVVDPLPTDPFTDPWPGRWWFAPTWPARDDPNPRLVLHDDGGLAPRRDGSDATGPTATEEVATWAGPPWTGIEAPFWAGSGGSQGTPGDQRADDARALSWTSPPLDSDLLLVGRPKATLWVTADRPVAQVAVKLTDVAEDHASALLARGLLNLTHRRSHAAPSPLEPGRPYRVELDLSTTAARVPAGHRIRVSIAGADWPLAWPSPEPVRLTVLLGGRRASSIVLPHGDSLTLEGPDLGLPATDLDESVEVLADPPPDWTIVRDPIHRRTTLTNGSGEHVRLGARDGLEYHADATYAVSVSDGWAEASAGGTIRYRLVFPGGPTIETEGRLVLVSDAAALHLEIEVGAWEDGRRVHQRTLRRSFPRDLL